DPDDVIRRDPGEWRSLVEAAKPVVMYVIDTLTKGPDGNDRPDLGDPKVKTDIAAKVLPLIEDVSTEAERNVYWQKLARVLRIDLDQLHIPREHTRRPKAASVQSTLAAQQSAAPEPAAEPAAPADVARTRLEAFCLGRLLLQPALLYRADRELQALGLAKLA